MRFFVRMAAAAACVALAAAPASATRPHARTGLFVGFGLGLGDASWDWTVSAPDSRHRGSGTGNLRVGIAVRDNLVVGFEGVEWIKSYDLDADGVDVGDAEVSLIAATVAATWFPRGHGAYLRGGVGFAAARGQLDVVEDGVHLDATDLGVALLSAAGFEWRLSDHFAAGPQIEFVYFGVSGDVVENAVLYDGSAQFTWYW